MKTFLAAFIVLLQLQIFATMSKDGRIADVFKLADELKSVGLVEFNAVPYLYNILSPIMSRKRSLDGQYERYKFPDDCYGYNPCPKSEKNVKKIMDHEEMMEIQQGWNSLTSASNSIVSGLIFIFNSVIILFISTSIMVVLSIFI